jgi:hypothetical protein
MSFDGPDARDYENVVSLNHAWLCLQRRDPQIRRGLDNGARLLSRELAGLDAVQAERLAATPFLLFSFREQDDVYWTSVLERQAAPDLFRSDGSRDSDMLISAALGFIWQLACRNPYALRLICGASLYWCERLTETPFYELLAAVRCAGELPVPRLAGHTTMWQKLLGDGVSGDENVRAAAQLSALQSVLTETYRETGGRKLALAASRINAPGLRVAEDNDPHSNS